MYSNLLAREQLRAVHRLWNQQQIKVLTAYTSRHLFVDSSADSAEKISKTSLVKQIQNEQYFSVDNRERREIIEQNISISKRETASHTDIESLAPNYNIKQLLYSEEDDVIKLLNNCVTSEEIIKVFHGLGRTLHKEHVIQTIIVLWALCKNQDNTFDVADNLLSKNVIPYLSDCIGSLDLNEMSACYLYLRKMGIESTVPLMQELLIRSLKVIEKNDNIVGLPALSRLLVGISTGGDFFMPMLCAHFLRHMDHHVNTCATENDARLIAVSMMCVQPLINENMMNKYKIAVKQLLETKELTPKTVMKILNMLNKPVWSHKHVPLTRDLLLSLQPVVKQIDANDLKNICRIYQHQMEPAVLHETLAETVESLLSTNMSPETLACFAPFSQPHKRECLINAYKALVSSNSTWEQPNASSHLFSTLRILKISDSKICDAYWNGVLSQLDTLTEGASNTKFLKHCSHYMHFNNNLGGTYRHFPLEKKLSKLCMSAIEHDIYGRIPQKFAYLASFVFAYGHTPFHWKKYPNILLSKVINMSDQFSPVDCSVLSRGLQISNEMRFRNRTPHLIGMQLATVDSVLVSCMERHLNNDKLSATEINVMVRALSNRKAVRNSVVYHKILQKYKDVKYEELNSRIIKDMAFNFMATNYLVPEALEAMFKYLENNYLHVGGETVEKLLTCIYNLGYTPESYESLYYAGQILLRDFNYMSGLSLVQSCLALCFYKTIPEELINKVFCVKFIQRIEDEIQMCYSKATYPERVLNVVMQLNRSVCLDFPEAQVPWFQQNFIEAQISKRPNVVDSFGEEVKKLLTKLLKDDSYIRFNHTTPYGYHIDFVINFDRDKKLIKANDETTMLDRITKVAILLLKLDSFCANDLKTLRGPESLKMKHLEMMGYKVLHINEHDWNSKYMNAPEAKSNYLKCLLQISR